LSVEIKVLDEKSIGKYFQAAALGYILEDLPENLREKILRGFTTGTITLNLNEANQLVNNLALSLNKICNAKESTPKLYTAGDTSDREIISEMAPGTPYEFSKDKKGPQLCSWLISIAQTLVENANKPVDMPMFLRTYVFSKYRDFREVEGEKVNGISLYVASAGALISIIAKQARGNSNFEFYLVPDASVESLQNAPRIYTITHATGNGLEGLEKRIRGFLRVENISLELTLLLSIALHVSDVTKHVMEMPPLTGLFNVFEKFRLINIECSGKRPLVVWERPLTITHILQVLDKRGALDILNMLYYASKHSNMVEKAGDVISQCISALFAYTETGSLDAVFLCGASAQRISDQFGDLCRKNKSDEACKGELYFKRLTGKVARLVGFHHGLF